MKQEHKFEEGEIVKHKLTKDKLFLIGYMIGSHSHGPRCWCRDRDLKEVEFYESELEKISNK